MEHRNFGNTDLSCSTVGFGTWEMGTTQYGEIDIQDAVRAVQMAVDHGITLYDTAEVYGPYTSEELLAKGLGNRRKDIVLVSKVGFTFYDDTSLQGNDAISGGGRDLAFGGNPKLPPALAAKLAEIENKDPTAIKSNARAKQIVDFLDVKEQLGKYDKKLRIVNKHAGELVDHGYDAQRSGRHGDPDLRVDDHRGGWDGDVYSHPELGTYGGCEREPRARRHDGGATRTGQQR